MTGCVTDEMGGRGTLLVTFMPPWGGPAAMCGPGTGEFQLSTAGTPSGCGAYMRGTPPPCWGLRPLAGRCSAPKIEEREVAGIDADWV